MLSRALKCQIVSHASTKDHKRNWNRLITHRPLRKYRACLKGPHREVKAGVGREREAGPGNMPLLGSMGEVLWVPRLTLDWSIQTKKNGVSVNSVGILSKGHTKGNPWETKETIDYQGCWESHIRDLYLLVPASCYQGHVLTWVA